MKMTPLELLRIEGKIFMVLRAASDLKHALDEALSLIVKIEGIDCGIIYLLNTETGNLRSAAHRGLSRAYVKRISVLKKGSPLHNLITGEKATYTIPPGQYITTGIKSQQREKILSEAGIPILHQGKAIAALHVGSHSLASFNRRIIYALESIATHIGAAVARIEAEEKLREQEGIFHAIFEQSPIAIAISDPKGTILRANPAFERLLGYSAEEIEGRSVLELTEADGLERESDMFMGAFRDKKNLVTMEKKYLGKDGSIIWAELHSSICYDLQGHPLYIIAMAKDIGIHRKAEEELRQSREELRSLSEHLHSQREQERAKIARELHDDLAQTLTAVNMHLFLLEGRIPPEHNELKVEIRDTIGLISTTIGSVKKIMDELHPSILDELGLEKALSDHAHQFTKRTAIACNVCTDMGKLHLDTDISTDLFRIVQEALVNVERHSQAKNVDILLKEKNGEIVLVISDDGTGIRKEKSRQAGGYGLLGVKERVHNYGGRFNAGTGKEKGTEILIQIPYSTHSRARASFPGPNELTDG